jgi:hypothetical protein
MNQLSLSGMLRRGARSRVEDDADYRCPLQLFQMPLSTRVTQDIDVREKRSA